jgi:hypothetical protein
LFGFGLQMRLGYVIRLCSSEITRRRNGSRLGGGEIELRLRNASRFGGGEIGVRIRMGSRMEMRLMDATGFSGGIEMKLRDAIGFQMRSGIVTRPGNSEIRRWFVVVFFEFGFEFGQKARCRKDR